MLLQKVKQSLGEELKPYLSGRCAHLKGRGGSKGAIRLAQRASERFPFVARFDIWHYYECIDHNILLDQLNAAGESSEFQIIVRYYLRLPDEQHRGVGMVAGGAISPLLAALYLTPLDRQMEVLEARSGIRYKRFMDDFVIFASTRTSYGQPYERCTRCLPH